MAKMNCWEYKQCGRQLDGPRAKEPGVCPAAVNFTNAGKNDGTAAGRICWSVAGTLCGGRIQGTTAEKVVDCTKCDFFNMVMSEEGATFQLR